MAMEDGKLQWMATTHIPKRWRGEEESAHLKQLLEQPGLTDEENATINSALEK